MAAPVIPAKQKAAVYDNPGTVSTKVVEIDVPEPGPGEVLVNLTHSGVCHSDLGIMKNAWESLPFPTKPGQIGGHEGVGRIAKFGPGAESIGLKIGDRVGIKWISSACGNCQPCQAGSDGVCFQQKISGYYTPGTFQQYTTGPAHYVTKIPDNVPSAEAAPLLCAGLTVLSAVKRSNTRPGQWIVISGAGGGLGHLAVQMTSRGMGMRVIGIDHGSKADLVKSSGAEHFVDITQFSSSSATDIGSHVRSLTTEGLGAHAVIVCTASNAAYAQSLDFLRFDGTMVCLGMPENSSQPIATALPSTMVFKHLTITGKAVGNRTDAVESLDFAARGIIKSHVRTEKLENLTALFKEMEAGKLQGRVVLDLS